MKDYIFIILAIVLFIISAVGHNKNKKERKPMPGGRVSTNPFEPLVNGTFLEEEQPVPAGISSPTSVPVAKKQDANLFIQNRIKAKKQVPEPVKPLQNKDISGNVEPKGVEEKKSGLLKDFSMKKAIIYSEIVNRKY